MLSIFYIFIAHRDNPTGPARAFYMAISWNHRHAVGNICGYNQLK